MIAFQKGTSSLEGDVSSPNKNNLILGYISFWEKGTINLDFLPS